MASGQEMRQTLEAIGTKIQLLRQFEQIKDSLEHEVDRLNSLKNELPKDVLGNASGSWADLTDRHTELHSRLLSIQEAFTVLETAARLPSFKETTTLVVYAVVIPLLLLVPIFLCVCRGALPIPIASNASGGKAINNSRPEEDRENAGRENQAPEDSNPTNGTASSETSKAAPVHAGYIWLLIVCLGALGGCLRLISSLILYIGQRVLFRSWLPYYYLAPFESALLAMVICLLVASGIVQLKSDESNSSIATSMPLVYLYALSVFSGLFAKNVLRKLRDVADALFTKPSAHNSA